jgi:hypothetical protein
MQTTTLSQPQTRNHVAREVVIGQASLGEVMHAFLNRIPIRGIHTFATHPGPHPEELLFYVILKESNTAKKIFPGVENCAFGQLTKTQMLKSNFWGNQGFFKALHAGIMIAGLGGGYFDEHTNRNENISAVQMLVEHLGLYRDKQDKAMFRLLVDYVNFEDNNSSDLMKYLNLKGHNLDKETADVLATQRPGQFSLTLKKGFASHATLEDYKKTLYWGIEFFEIHVRQARLFIAGNEEYPTVMKKIYLHEEKQKGYIVCVKSDNPVMRSVINSRFKPASSEGLKFSILVNSANQFCISLHQKSTKDKKQMEAICYEIRILIAQKLGRKTTNITTNPEDWTVPEVYIDKNSWIISNGSNVDRDVEGTFHLIENELVDICKKVYL